MNGNGFGGYGNFGQFGSPGGVDGVGGPNMGQPQFSPMMGMNGPMGMNGVSSAGGMGGPMNPSPGGAPFDQNSMLAQIYQNRNQGQNMGGQNMGQPDQQEMARRQAMMNMMQLNYQNTMNPQSVGGMQARVSPLGAASGIAQQYAMNRFQNQNPMGQSTRFAGMF